MAFSNVRFRAQTRAGNWVYGMPITVSGKHYIIPKENEGVDAYHLHQVIIPVEGHTICQSLQMPDKEGNMVYEQDIIEDKDGKRVQVFSMIQVHRHWKYKRIAYCKVVGNMIDNPNMI